MVVTDSGGLHKEAYLHGTPCVTILRSGWMETVKGGWNQFVPPLSNEIVLAVNEREIDRTVERDDFGDGNACAKIVELMKMFLVILLCICIRIRLNMCFAWIILCGM